MKNLTPEMIEKAKSAKNAEELLAMAKANGVDMTKEEAETCFAQLNPQSAALDDDLLDGVAGGTGVVIEIKERTVTEVHPDQNKSLC